MAEVVPEIPQTATTEENMEVETEDQTSKPNGDSKRSREEEQNGDENQEEKDGASKKQKVEKSVEEERLEKGQGTEEEDEKMSEPVNLGPKKFNTSIEMFDYFHKFIHYWPPNLDVNKYEYMILLDLLKKGHTESDKKIGGGIQAFQIRYHPMWKSRCFFLIREDESVDDFSFRKCVDHILPLPENMKVNQDANKGLGGGGRGGRGGGRGGRGGGGGGRRGGGGRGRGGRSRN